MSIKRYELKKILSSPIFIILTVLFLIFNTFMIADKFRTVKDVNELSRIVSRVGYKIDDNMMQKFKDYYEKRLNEASSLITKKGYKSVKTIGEFLDENPIPIEGSDKFTKEESEFLYNTAADEGYYYLCSEKADAYNDLDINAVAKGNLQKWNYSEKIRSIVKKNYDDFAVRFKQIKADGEHKCLFFYGDKYFMHEFLFQDIFRVMIYEIMILTVLASAFIFCFEFDNKTHLVVYTSKRGRGLIKDKMAAAFAACIIVTTLILGITLLIYFSVFNYSGLFNTSVNSYFAKERNTFYLTWQPMTFLKYLISVIITVYIIEIIFCVIMLCLSVFIKNTYILSAAFLLAAVFLGNLPSMIPLSVTVDYFTIFSPFVLIDEPSKWFMFKNGDLVSSAHYEVITLLIWTAFMVTASLLCVRRFNRQDLK